MHRPFDPFDALRRFRSPLTVAAFALTSSAASAQFNVSHFTIDGGGMTRSTGGTFGVGGTLGQPDAGFLSGSTFALSGGFWYGGGATAVGVETPADSFGPPTARLEFRLYPARPNPITERTTVAFEIPAPARVRAALYDLGGRLVQLLADEPLPAGRHERAWDRRDRSGSTVSSGIYFLRLDAQTHRSVQKLVVVR